MDHEVNWMVKNGHPKKNELLQLAKADWKGSFETRLAVAESILGPATRVWTTSYPSGGGSKYAAWEGGDWEGTMVRLEAGGYDMITSRSFPKAPEIFLRGWPRR